MVVPERIYYALQLGANSQVIVQSEPNWDFNFKITTFVRKEEENLKIGSKMLLLNSVYTMFPKDTG